MAETKKAASAVEDEVYPVTTETPAKDDQVAYVVGDAGHEDSPVRTARPDVPIAAVLASGAGEHKPADPDVYDRDGRPLAVADGDAQAKRK